MFVVDYKVGIKVGFWILKVFDNVKVVIDCGVYYFDIVVIVWFCIVIDCVFVNILEKVVVYVIF